MSTFSKFKMSQSLNVAPCSNVQFGESCGVAAVVVIIGGSLNNCLFFLSEIRFRSLVEWVYSKKKY